MFPKSVSVICMWVWKNLDKHGLIAFQILDFYHFSCIEMLWWKYVGKILMVILCIVNMHINGNNLNLLENNGCSVKIMCLIAIFL